MWSDVIDLRDFYETSLGQTARRMIRRQIRAIWPDSRDMRVLGLGFATPYLRPFREETERVIALMPSSQGVLPWPPEGPSLVGLADETELPLPDRSIDRVLLVHALESTEQVRASLREIWRVLADSGRLLVVAPNRRGIWARLERTPFGQGRPYTPSQLTRLLRDNMYTPLQTTTALYMPPFRSRFVLRSAPAWEQIGVRWFPSFAGVLLVEAAKQIYAGSAFHEPAGKRRAYLPMPQGLRKIGPI
ncbi:methyltransferase domain-containing protein [Telmatospirillum sp.]|uniref:class I SAM-dependent methyltransferase n=1 Tax=Telmatospirillum sp. TaxID=2079197 RepID=UPI00283D7F3B|nr:methyltransferase domain-containing protein [Telmatospirillum sp.]MDR3440744.1 methyltransferase domain-containing protein [Telmatospirillum sp.]